MAVSRKEIAVGREFTTTLVEDLKRTTIVQYAGASGDYNPLHSDEVYAMQVAGRPSIFAHGMLTMGMTGRLVTDTFGVANLKRFGGRFTAIVFPGDTLTATLRIDAIDGDTAEVSIATKNQRGEVVFSGSAAARLAG
jgi:acyl dehydratase